MTFQRISILTSCLTLILLASACDTKTPDDTGADEGETGDPGEGEGDGDGDGDGDEGEDQTGYGGNCGEETVSVVDLDTALPGFDGPASDYLPLVEGAFSGEFAWLPEDGPVIIEHAGTASPLTVTVAYEGGEIRLTEVELVGQPPQGEGGLAEGELCGNMVQIDVTFGFATEDGLFAESMEVPITLYSHDEWLSPSFYFSLDMDALQGQLALDDFVVDEGMVSDLVLSGQFDGELVSGGLNIEILTMDWVGFGNIAGFDAVRTP